LLGSAMAGFPAMAQIGLLSLAGGVGAWLLAGLRIFGPGAVVIVFAGSAAAMTGDPAGAATATALGVAAGWVCAMVPLGPVSASGTEHERRWLRSGAVRLRSGESLAAGARIAAASAPAGWAAMAM